MPSLTPRVRAWVRSTSVSRAWARGGSRAGLQREGCRSMTLRAGRPPSGGSGRRNGRRGVWVQGDEASICRGEAAGIDVEGSKVILEVHMEPRAVGRTCLVGGSIDQSRSDSLAAESRSHERIEQEGVSGAVPGHVDEPDEFALLTGTDPAETVPVDLRPPVHRQRCVPESL